MRLLNSCLSLFVRSIVQNLLAFFRFTEADALVLLSAYGVHALDLDRLQDGHPNEPQKASGNVGILCQRDRTGEPPAPIPIGVHPISFGRTQLFPMWKSSVKFGNPPMLKKKPRSQELQEFRRKEPYLIAPGTGTQEVPEFLSVCLLFLRARTGLEVRCLHGS